MAYIYAFTTRSYQIPVISIILIFEHHEIEALHLYLFKDTFYSTKTILHATRL